VGVTSFLAAGLFLAPLARPDDVTHLELQRQIFAARDRVLPALVNISPVVRDFSSGKKEKSSVTGSGVVFRDGGYVVTNYHVAGEAEEIVCTLWNKERVRATLVGGDPMTDLAVLRLDFSDYEGETPPISSFGDSDQLETGQIVMALGSPFALSRSLSFGVVSTTDRYLSETFRLPSGERSGVFNTWIQTDAAINPGNSGGPLVDLAGNIVGINSRAFMLANNLGFSIPSNVVKKVVDEIIRNGRVERSWLGVEVQPLQELEEFFSAEQGGVLVSNVENDSPAFESGIRPGDLLLQVGGENVSVRFYEEIPGFYDHIAGLPVGTDLEIVSQRGGEVRRTTVRTVEFGRPMGNHFEARNWGFTVRGITKQMALELRLDSLDGVLVAGVQGGGSAEVAGLAANDVLHEVDGQAVHDLESFKKLYESLAGSDREQIMLNVKRRDSSRWVLLKLGSQKG
jgi:serine protease Do